MIFYNRKTGANCPRCGKRAPVVSSPVTNDEYRTRYHACKCGELFASTQIIPLVSECDEVRNMDPEVKKALIAHHSEQINKILSCK